VSRKSVRHAAAQFLQQPQIPGIGTVFASPPKISKNSDAYEGLPPGTESGSVVYIEILNVTETRIALGGPTQGTKKSLYTLRFHLLFRSSERDSQVAMDAHDDQVELILLRCREDRTLGTQGNLYSINQFGQGPSGITISTGMPKLSGTGRTHIWTIIDGDAMEIYTA
jgi:hypothetical protein